MRQDEEYVEERSFPMGFDGAVDLDVAETVATANRRLANSDGGRSLATPKVTSSTRKRKKLKSVAQARRSRNRVLSRADTIAGFERSDEQADEDVEEDEEAWLQTRLVVCLKFSSQVTDKMQRILAGDPVDRKAQVATPNFPAVDVPDEAPATPRDDPTKLRILDLNVSEAAATASTVTPSHGSDTDTDTDRSMRTLVPFERRWLDETRNVNVKDILGTLRAPNLKVSALPGSFNWFSEAVPVDALFPPGVPLSAKEIMAFYPHHIRWKGVALRLVNNAYFGDPIIDMQVFFRDKDKHPLTITNVNQFFRDVLKNEVPDFKVTKFQGKPSRNLYTDHLAPSKLLNGSRYGFVVPNFDELLEGLVHLPAGLDARDLTQCLAWYLGVRDTFTPRLNLNVLHTQSLVRALRMPLKPYGPRNLDKLALQEWKEKGQFAKRRVDEEEGSSGISRCNHSPEQLKRSRVTIDTETETLGVDVVVKLRHVLTFPYLAIGGMVSMALELGIEKAEARRAAREVQEGIEKPHLEDMEGTTEESSHKNNTAPMSSGGETGPQDVDPGPQEMPSIGMPVGYKIPKRKRPSLEDDAVEIQSTIRMSPAPGVSGAPLGPREMSVTERRHALAPHPLIMSNAPSEPLSGPTLASGPSPTTAPASISGHRRSPTPDHYHSAPYSSTFSNRYHPSPYTSRFFDYIPPSRYDSRTTSECNTPYSTQPRYGDRGMSEFAPRSHRESSNNPGWNLEHSARHQSVYRSMFPQRNTRYPSAQPESTSRRVSNGARYDSHRQQ